MKKIAITAATLGLATTMSATAADISTPSVYHTPVVAPVHHDVKSATGWYLRGDVGFAYNKLRGINYSVSGGTKVFDTTSLKENFIVGVGAGYKLNDYLYINSWVNSQGYLYRDIQMVKSLMIIILLLVVAVACFNIVSTLVMAVNEKRGDIAILKTMGASKWMLRFIFIVQGAFNGFVGCIVGAVFGVYIAENLTAIISKLEVLIGHKLLSGNIYFINYLPSQVNADEVVIITVTAFLMSVFATVYRAWRASNIQPALELGYSH